MRSRRNRITTPPGAILLDASMKPLALSANKLAAALHVPANRISAIFPGTRGITADTAMRLGRTFNTTAEFRLSLPTTHDLTKAQTEVGAEIERRVRPRDSIYTCSLSMFPLCTRLSPNIEKSCLCVQDIELEVTTWLETATPDLMGDAAT